MLQTYACIQYIVSDTQCTNKAKHSEMGPVRQNTIQRTVRSVHVCALHCAQLLHAILLRTDLIIFPLTLQIISKAIRRRLQLVLISHSPQHTNTMNNQSANADSRVHVPLCSAVWYKHDQCAPLRPTVHCAVTLQRAVVLREYLSGFARLIWQVYAV